MRNGRAMMLFKSSFPMPSRSVFDKTIARDWYDGLTSGITKSAAAGVAFRFDIIAWGPAQENRVFAFAPMSTSNFDRIVELLATNQEPVWPIWFPEWPMWRSPGDAESTEIMRLLLTAGHAEYAVVSDSMFKTLLAAKLLDDDARGVLPATYDGIPSSDSYQYWSEFVGLSR
jgi:hypothetical protein